MFFAWINLLFQGEIEDLKDTDIMNQIINNIFMPQLANKDEFKEASYMLYLFLNYEILDTKLGNDCNPMLVLNVFKEIYCR